MDVYFHILEEVQMQVGTAAEAILGDVQAVKSNCLTRKFEV